MFCKNCSNTLDPSVKFCPRCGAAVTAAAPAYSPPGDQVQTSWAAAAPGINPPQRKSRVGKILLILFAVFVLIAAGAGVAVYYGYKAVERALKNSEAYTLAVSALKENKMVSERFGEIKETGFPIGSFSEEADGTGRAAFTMSIAGTKANGRYFVTMERNQGTWKLHKAFVKLPDDEVINVVDPMEESIGYDESNDEIETGDEGNANGENSNTTRGRKPVSGGVLDGKALSKAEPVYPSVAKLKRASGTVTVEVTVDEAGRVISARATSGHALLRQAAVEAAKKARFAPTKISGQPVKVNGVLTYNFAL